MIEFSKLSQQARIWVYTTDRFITDDEKNSILLKCNQFLATWSAHGDKLHASADILDNCFLILAVDEDHASASGCSIDKSTKFLKTIEDEYNLSLLDWQNIAYIDNNQIKLTTRDAFKQIIKESDASDKFLICNPNLQTKSDLDSNRTICIQDSSFSNLLSVKS